MVDTDPLNTTTSRICVLCSSQAKYTCPRCRTPTCSLPCSRKHKQYTGCSGERNKAEYVPMNAYGWGTMMRDYSFLEEVGRKASEWGNEIVRGKYQAERGKSSRINSLGRPNVRGKRTKGTKRDTLKSYLESVDIDIDLLPNGMERRGLSQSTWDPKLKRPLLTIEFKFYPPSTPTPTAEVVRPQPHTVIVHRNPISKTLLDILRSHISQQPLQSRKHSLPDWVPPLVHPHPEDPEGFVHPDCYVRASLDFHYRPASQAEFYHKLDPASPLLELLRNTHFVEFPTIHIFDRDASSFRGTVVDKTGRITRRPQDEAYGRAPKRRKTNVQAIAGLLGDYGSSSESENDQPQKNDGLLMLGSYSENEIMEATSGVRPFHDVDDETGSPEESCSSDVEEMPIKPEMLLELMKRARQAADEDIDWGDESPDDEGTLQ